MTNQTLYTVHTYDEDDYGLDAYTSWVTIFTSKDKALAKIKAEFEDIFEHQELVELSTDQYNDHQEIVSSANRDCSICFVITTTNIGE